MLAAARLEGSRLKQLTRGERSPVEPVWEVRAPWSLAEEQAVHSGSKANSLLRFNIMRRTGVVLHDIYRKQNDAFFEGNGSESRMEGSCC